MHTGDLFDFGPQAGDGILTVLPPKLVGSPYPTAVPKTDADGNTLAGIRLPDVAAPIRPTPAGIFEKIRRRKAAITAACMFRSPVRRRNAWRAADSRLSLEERYLTHAAYVTALAEAAEGLRREGLLLDEDVERYKKTASDSLIGK